MTIPMVDLKAQYSSIKEEIDQAVNKVLSSGRFILGEEVRALEEEIAGFIDVDYAVGVASGTEALLLALIACGVESGDEVITTPFTFIATTETIAQCGASPVFVDIEPETYNIDPTKIEDKITKKTKAILPVHLYGQSVDMEPILKLAQKYNLKVIEDCAQAFGTEYKGQKVGSLGDIGCLSFFPSKILGGYGDGGMVVTNSNDIAQKMRMLRNHGSRQKYYHLINGFNSRLDELQAAILRVKLKHIDGWNELRCDRASLYNKLLGDIDGIEPPFTASYGRHIFNYYTIRVKGLPTERNKLQDYLKSKGIQTAIYYPLSLHLQEVYKSLGYQPGDFPNSEQAQEYIISLPIYPELTNEQIEEIVTAIREFITSKNF